MAVVYLSTDRLPALPDYVIRAFDSYIEPPFIPGIPNSVPIVPVTGTWNQDVLVLSRTRLHLSLARGIENSQVSRPYVGKIVIEIERSAGTAFETQYRTCYLAGIMILPPLSRDRFTNIAKSSHLCANLKNRDI